MGVVSFARLFCLVAVVLSGLSLSGCAKPKSEVLEQIAFSLGDEEVLFQAVVTEVNKPLLGPNQSIVSIYARTDDGQVVHQGDYSAATDGALNALISGGSHIGAAAARRPTRIDVSQTGGGGSADASASGSSSSSSVSAFRARPRSLTEFWRRRWGW